jgi:hypothetical protein
LKKLAAILLILTFLFNLGGYRLWFYYQQQQSDEKLEAVLDNEEYNEEDIITLKVPISLPYQTNWKEFERAEGEINYNGKIYKYVKRKIYNGELILLCIPDHNRMRLETAKGDFFRLANDLVQNNSSKKSNDSKAITYKNLLNEYDQHLFILTLKLPDNISQNFGAYIIEYLISFPYISPEQPPDLFS